MQLTKYTLKNRRAYITLSRAEKRNALNTQMINELKAHLKTAEQSDAVKVIILSGEGSAFCAGADLEALKQMQNNSFEDNLEDSKNLAELYKQIYCSPKIVIALLNGHAIAGGAGLATVCDFVFSVPEAKYGYTETAIGFVPAIVSIFLLRKIGEAKAKELLLTGKIITAEEALEAGIFNHVAARESLNEYCESFAQNLIDHKSADSLRQTKQLINRVQGTNLNEALDYAARLNAESRNTKDCKCGISAFLNKEKIVW